MGNAHRTWDLLLVGTFPSMGQKHWRMVIPVLDSSNMAHSGTLAMNPDVEEPREQEGQRLRSFGTITGGWKCQPESTRRIPWEAWRAEWRMKCKTGWGMEGWLQDAHTQRVNKTLDVMLRSAVQHSEHPKASFSRLLGVWKLTFASDFSQWPEVYQWGMGVGWGCMASLAMPPQPSNLEPCSPDVESLIWWQWESVWLATMSSSWTHTGTFWNDFCRFPPANLKDAPRKWIKLNHWSLEIL